MLLFNCEINTESPFVKLSAYNLFQWQSLPSVGETHSYATYIFSTGDVNAIVNMISVKGISKISPSFQLGLIPLIKQILISNTWTD